MRTHFKALLIKELNSTAEIFIKAYIGMLSELTVSVKYIVQFKVKSRHLIIALEARTSELSRHSLLLVMKRDEAGE